MAILEAGRATVEITSTAHQQVIDRIEADDRPSSRIRLAFEVDDAQTTTDRLQGAGGQVISAPVRTPVAVAELPARRPGRAADHPLPGTAPHRKTSRHARVQHRTLILSTAHPRRHERYARMLEPGQDPHRNVAFVESDR